MLFEVKDLTLGYEKENIIENISFVVENKDFIIVVGKNGAGKSTLIKGILGLIKPKSGKIIFGDGLKKNLIGYMPQETKVDQAFPASVKEIVLSGRINKMGLRPFYNKEDKEKANEVMNILNISNIKNKSFADLSGGQRQKVLLARSLAATDKLLILDEPSNNLDNTSREEFYLLLMKLNKELGITIIMISHDADIDKMLGNKLLRIKDKGYEFTDIVEE
ncbi:MAG: ATP-binding cassette domain-containing protein [Acholeplasmatales bacterium]|nr:ATP-binding cassette domain-containing protein [Acholeplasmatales bacterium]